MVEADRGIVMTDMGPDINAQLSLMRKQLQRANYFYEAQLEEARAQTDLLRGLIHLKWIRFYAGACIIQLVMIGFSITAIRNGWDWFFQPYFGLWK